MAEKQSEFLKLVKQVEEKSAPSRRDEEHATITHYVNMFLSKFGKEGCMLAGSTAERTRVRLNRNVADSDFLLICGKAVIPTTCLEYKEECPCFVSIKGKDLLQYFKVDLIDGLYLPADLLRNVRPEAFSLLRIIHKALTKTVYAIGDYKPRDIIKSKTKVGTELKEYRDADMYDKNQSVPEKTEKRALNTKERKVADLFKIICEILMNLKNPEVSKDLLKQNIPLLFQMFIPGQLDLINGQDDIEQVTQRVENEMNLSETIESGNDGACNDKVTIRYESISSIDYVPCFHLSDPPKGFDLWVYRERQWPRNEVVEDIAKSEFFLVAKPSLVNGRPDIDFCLAFTVAEKKLFDEVYKVPVQRNCYLVIKAMHKADLIHQNVIKTFHWKTAFFWICENRRVWTGDKLLTAVMDVLALMVTSLEKRELNHFFIKSNLFADLKRVDMKPKIDEIILKIKRIQTDPVSALGRFLRLDETNEYDVTVVHKSEAHSAKAAKRLKAESVGAKRLNEALTDMFKQAAGDPVCDPIASGSQPIPNKEQPAFDTDRLVNATVDIAQQVAEDAKSKKTFLTKLEKPLFSGQEADLIGRAAELLSAKSTDEKSSETQVSNLSKDIAEYLVPRTMMDIDLD